MDIMCCLADASSADAVPPLLPPLSFLLLDPYREKLAFPDF
jgi:hypothetical protein